LALTTSPFSVARDHLWKQRNYLWKLLLDSMACHRLGGFEHAESPVT
jgi:hypothetical protein